MKSAPLAAHPATFPGRQSFHTNYPRRLQNVSLLEDTPDFAFDPATVPYRSGVRPYRKVTFRLEPETIAGKFVVHNYGHGGAGITMSWGCAEVVREIVTQHGASGGVAVLGAGVMGLTVATLLTEIRPKISLTVYAEKFTPCTTSDIAGGQWAPSLVNFKAHDSSAKLTYFDVLRRARKAHEKRIGSGFGVSRRWNYTSRRIDHLDILPTDIVPPATKLNRLPFAKLAMAGFKYDLLLVEPPILMSKLQSDLAAAGVRCVRKTFKAVSDLGDLKESVIVNCTGLGSRDLFNDDLMVPIKGQLVFLRPQTNLNYLFSGDGHVFPRTDAVVIGGSEERGASDSTPDAVMCKKMVMRIKQLFDGPRFPTLRKGFPYPTMSPAFQHTSI
jgi:D-amino-acid oxidase